MQWKHLFLNQVFKIPNISFLSPQGSEQIFSLTIERPSLHELLKGQEQGLLQTYKRKIKQNQPHEFFSRNIYFCFIDYAKVFDCVYHNKLWKILQEMGKQTTWLVSSEIRMQVRKQQLELDMEQQTGFK